MAGKIAGRAPPLIVNQPDVGFREAGGRSRFGREPCLSCETTLRVRISLMRRCRYLGQLLLWAEFTDVIASAPYMYMIGWDKSQTFRTLA
jgi:hypothetical protein